MPKAPKAGFYAVNRGHSKGVFLTWEECQAQVTGYPNARYKKFANASDAEAFVKGGIAPVRPSTAKVNSTQKLSPKTQTNEDEDVVYCDGACKGNGGPGSRAGIGIWWGHGDKRNVSERCPGDQTNNRAELIAIIRVLEATPRSSRPLVITTDSRYSIQCIEDWFAKWLRNDFRLSNGLPVKNASVIKYLYALVQQRRKNGQPVKFVHVRGHQGVVGNEGADQLANIGAEYQAIPERDWEELEDIVSNSIDRIKDKEDAPLRVEAGGRPVLSQPIGSNTVDKERDKPKLYRALSDVNKLDLDLYTDCASEASLPPSLLPTPRLNTKPAAMSVNTDEVDPDLYADCVDDFGVDVFEDSDESF